MSNTGNVKLNLPVEINQPLNDATASQCGASEVMRKFGGYNNKNVKTETRKRENATLD